MRCALLLLLLPLTGCTHTWTDVTVSVRDVETQVPITNARVQIRPNWLYLPMPESGDPQLNPNARPGEIVTVGADGTALVEVPSDLPFEVVLLTPLQPVQGRTFGSLPDPDAWHMLLVGDEYLDVGAEIRITR